MAFKTETNTKIQKEELPEKKEAGSIEDIAKQVKEAAGAFGKQAKEEKGIDSIAQNTKTPEKELAMG